MNRPRRRRPGKPRLETLDVQIDSLGAQGDGVLDWHGERLIVPLALPGETWRVRRRDQERIVEPLSCLVPSPERRPPLCRHFGACGGCTLQHLPETAYGALLIGRIEGALRSRGLAPPGPIALHRSPLGSRRRLRLGFTADGQLGFRRRLGRQLVKIAECPIARPALAALLEPLGRLLRQLAAASAGGEVTLTALDDGVEVVLHLQHDPGLEDRQALAAFAAAEGLVRLAIAVDGVSPEPVAGRLPPRLTVAGVALAVPPAPFLQATAEGEAALQDFVARQLDGARKVVDLFSGLGTLSLGLAAAGASVRAFDGAAELIGACRHAHVQAVRRDLQQSPLQPDELAGCDAVILDPPRAGAAAQVEALAASAVPRLVYASCEPATFARDAAALVQGGYRLIALEAVDQFLFGSDVELVASFVRDAT